MIDTKPEPHLRSVDRRELSIVLPCRNGAPHLERQLSALSEQTWHGAWELVFVDNGSTDESVAIAEDFAPRLPRLKIVTATNCHERAYACNAGAMASFGAALLFIDADDEVSPNYLEVMATALQRHNLVVGHVETASLNDSWIKSSRLNKGEGMVDSYDFLPYGSGAALGITRELFDRLGGFSTDVPFAEDADLCWRAQLLGFDLTHVAEATLAYRLRGDFRSLFRQSRNYGKGSVRLYRKFQAYGMPRRSWRQVLRDIKFLVWMPLRTRPPAQRARWIARLGKWIGRLEESIRVRTLYL